MKPRDKSAMTIFACYMAYIVQAVVNNLPPLLFLTFQRSFGIGVEKIGALISLNFGVQILVDYLAARHVDRWGHRRTITIAHGCCAAGLLALGILPRVLPDAYAGLAAAIFLNAVGGGLIEVLVSPMVEAVPSSGAKAAAMSLLHSFYCWGHVAVVLLSTLGFRLLGMERWYLLPMLWSLLPLANLFVFLRVPIYHLPAGKSALPARKLLSLGVFWLLFALMVCAGAAEQAMSQWASVFAEEGLRQSKTVGDLLGPCLFATLMGLSRVFYGKFGSRIPLRAFMAGSGALCIASYLLAVLSPHPLPALLGCGLCGLSVGILWPGTFSIAARLCPQGGTLLFGLLALAGDLGCAGGPALVSLVSHAAPSVGLKAGLAAAIIFPAAMLPLLLRVRARGVS